MSCVRACVRTCVCVCLCACMRMRVGSGSVLCGRQNFLRLTNWYKKILLFIAIFPSPHILSVHPAHGPFQSLLNESLLLLAVFYFSSFVCASATQKITNSFFFFTPERFQWKFIFGVFFFFCFARESVLHNQEVLFKFQIYWRIWFFSIHVWFQEMFCN